MPVSFRSRSVGGALVATLALGSGVHAATITQTQTYASGGVHPFTVNQFDPSLGTLVSVSLGLTGGPYTYNTSVYRNTTDVTQTGTANITPRVLVEGSVFAGDNLFANADVGPTVGVPYTIQPFSVAPNDLWSSRGSSLNDFSVSTAAITNATVLAAYTGPGTRIVNTVIGSAVTFTPDTGTYQLSPYGSLGGGSNGTVTMTVTYVYNPIPEPAAASVLALAALGTLRRYRRQG